MKGKIYLKENELPDYMEILYCGRQEKIMKEIDEKITRDSLKVKEKYSKIMNIICNLKDNQLKMELENAINQLNEAKNAENSSFARECYKHGFLDSVKMTFQCLNLK